MKQQTTINYLIKILTLLGLMYICICNIWGQNPVTTATAESGKSYILAAYSGGKYYALPQITANATFSGIEVIVNANGKVVKEQYKTLPLWTLIAKPSSANQFYLTHQTSSTFYLYKNGTEDTNYNIKASPNVNERNYWQFSKTLDNNAYNIVAVDRGSNHTYLNYYSSKFQVRGTSASTSGNNNTSMILLEVEPTLSYTISVAANNSSFGSVSLDGTTIIATPNFGYRVITGTGGYAVISGTATIVSNNDNTFIVTPNSDCTIQINFEAIPMHTVTWSVNGVTSTNQVMEGSAITFNTPQTGIPTGKVFMGWSDRQIGGTNPSVPQYVTCATMGTTDITYYAVFATATPGATIWTKTDASEVTAGTYAIITTDGHAFNGSIRSGHGKVTSEAFSFIGNIAISPPEGTLEITLTASNSGFTMYNDNHGYLYAKAAASGNLAWSMTNDSYWSYASNDDNWEYASNNAHLRTVGDSAFRTYSGNSGKVLQFAKKNSNSTYSDYTTSVSTMTSLVISGTPLKSVYSVGDSFEHAGLRVTAYYSEGDPVDVTGEAVFSYSTEPLSFGTTVIDVMASYMGVESETFACPITVNKKASAILIDDIVMGLSEERTVMASTIPDDAELSYTIYSGSECIAIEGNTIMSVTCGTAMVIVHYDGNEEYAAADKSFKVTVVAVEGNSVLVADTENGSFVMTTTMDGSRFGSAPIYKVNGKYVYPGDENGVVFKIENNNGNVTIQRPEDAKYVQATGAGSMGYADNSYTWYYNESALAAANSAHGTLQYDANGGCFTNLTNLVGEYAQMSSLSDGYVRKPLTAGNWGTICLSCAVAADDYRGVTFYSMIGYRMKDKKPYSVVVDVATGDLVAGQPYFILVDNESAEFVAAYTGAPVVEPTDPNNGLVGSFTQRVLDNSSGMIYLLKSNKMYQVGKNASVGANKAYVDLSKATLLTSEVKGAREFSIDEPSGVVDVDVDDDESSEIYNLDGQRIGKLQKGINIVKGRKVLF